MNKFECDKNLSRHVAKSPPGKIWLLVVVNYEFSKFKQVLSEQFSNDKKVLSMVKETLHFKNVVLVALSCLPEKFQDFDLVKGLVKEVFRVFNNLKAQFFMKLGEVKVWRQGKTSVVRNSGRTKMNIPLHHR